MKELELNIASEYLVMAATLLAIKSQMLLPKQEVDEDVDEYEEDPREELIRRLIEYRKFKESAEHLKKKERSEEHTSELQSRGHLVCRLLLEKKKNIIIT